MTPRDVCIPIGRLCRYPRTRVNCVFFDDMVWPYRIHNHCFNYEKVLTMDKTSKPPLPIRCPECLTENPDQLPTGGAKCA